LVAFEIDGKMYAIGGASFSGTQGVVEVYDPKTDVWTQKAGMKTPRTSISGCAVGNKIIVIGGSLKPGMDLSSAVEVYNTKLDMWTSMKNLPNPRVALSCIVIGNRIYAVGGSIREWPFKPEGTVEVFEFNE
jgi:N-acetylneuraminic acid mutarotase